jgi:hypothetical protein
MATNSQVRRGFPNLDLVRGALKRLIPRIKDGTLPPLPPDPWDGWRDYDHADHIISAQRLARAIVKSYGLDVGTVIVSFIHNLEAAGQVELGSSRDYFVELRDELKDHPGDITACLGHEVAHIFLHRHHLTLPQRLPNEILTDVTAALYGFGPAMADTFRIDNRRRLTFGGVRVTRTERAMGYLTPDELGYVLTRNGCVNFGAYLHSPAARAAMRVGYQRAVRELTTPPLRVASIARRLSYRVSRWRASRRRVCRALGTADLYAFFDGYVSFRCPVCCQGLRLPQHHTLEARCPICTSMIPCVT